MEKNNTHNTDNNQELNNEQQNSQQSKDIIENKQIENDTQNRNKDSEINKEQENFQNKQEQEKFDTKAQKELQKQKLKEQQAQQKEQKLIEAQQLKEQKNIEKQQLKQQKLQQKIDRTNRNVLWLWFLGLLLATIVILFLWDTSRKTRFMKIQQKKIDSLLVSNHFFKTKYQEKDSALNKMLSNYNKILSENIVSSSTLEKQKQELLNLQNTIYKQDSIMQSIKKTIEQALTGYTAEQLSVQMINGKLYVTLREKLLFPSGSTVVSEQGLLALNKIAKVLKNTQNIDLTIEGHTDNVPISPKNKQFRDNWDLSTARAVEVSRILIEKFGIRPEIITAAGKSMYFPIAPNTTETGKARNRRIEFIISPNLSELYKIIDKNQNAK